MTPNRSLIPLVLAGATLALAACGSSASQEDDSERDDTGEVVEGGDVGAFRLQVGDCIESLEFDETIESLPVVPCAESHEGEVFHSFDLTGTDFPGDAALQDEGASGCLDAFDGYVGIDFFESIYDLGPITPSERSWNVIGDREVLCVLFRVDGQPSTGSARGTAQ